MFFDTRNFLHYWRLSPDGTRVLFGGRTSFSPTTVERSRDPLYAGHGARCIPSSPGCRVDRAWGGQVALTADRLPHVGRHPETGVVYAMGYCGSGVALSVHFGRAVGRWLCGDGELPAFAARPWRPVPGPAACPVAPARGRVVVPGARRAGALSDRHRRAPPRASSAGDGGAELAEDLDVAVDVGVLVLDRQRPLLLVARRHEDAPVDEPRPRGVEEVGVGLEEAAVVDEGLGAGTTRSPCSRGR